ncbi:hypothetical protein Tco_0537313 [Tanacetum coccineum]|uniref:Uncharacterized protein n=1 Tax=Tanacetum coccineum TaxID=301880 RepID=A0ABQ4Y6Z9_9ASTR
MCMLPWLLDTIEEDSTVTYTEAPPSHDYVPVLSTHLHQILFLCLEDDKDLEKDPADYPTDRDDEEEEEPFEDDADKEDEDRE